MSGLRWVPVLCVASTGCMAQGLAPGSIRDGGSDLDPNAAATACSVAVAVFEPRCTACHKVDGQAPNLTFEALEALVAANTVIRPGDAAGSLLFRKIAGLQAAAEGGTMPPGGMLSADRVALVRRWIDEGATFDCEVGKLPDPVSHHPEGFAEPLVHGTELKLGPQDCRTCHGTDLTGGIAPSCDDCHEDGWRTKCTFCHGSTIDDTGAPPRDLDGTTVVDMLTFRAHPMHVGDVRHAPFDCTTCHNKPEDVLSVGHIFDDTRGHAEVSFTGGLSSEGRYDGNGQCSNLYCHGNGQVTGSFSHTEPTPTCDSCHAGPTAGRDRWATMSGEHEDHLREGIICTDCHGATVDGSNTIVGPTLHVNGTVDLMFQPGTITRTRGTCSGVCHMEDHDAESWR